MLIAVDFDGSIVKHRYPYIGDPVPNAIHWMNEWIKAGAKLILWTMRDDEYLSEAIQYCENNGVIFYDHNRNPMQDSWTKSPKCYAHKYIDDSSIMCPLIENPRMGGHPHVDWSIVGPIVMKILDQQFNHEKKT